MKFVFGKVSDERNVQLLFIFEPKTAVDCLEIYAADSCTVTADGKLISYGPERCAQGYARLRRIPLDSPKRVEIRTHSFGVPNYSVDHQPPYLGARLLWGEEEIMSCDDLACAYIEECRIARMPRYSGQRGFTEGYDLTKTALIPTELYEVEPPVLLCGNNDNCAYLRYTPKKISEKTFSEFDDIKPLRAYLTSDFPREGEFSVEDAIERAKAKKYTDELFSFSAEKSGFLSFEIDAQKEGELIAFFEEICPDGKWIFRRPGNNDFTYVKYPKGKSRVTLNEPFTMKLLRLVHPDGCQISPSLIGLENNKAECVQISGDERLVRVFEAARNTFMQNAVDIFMDCPGRERAGWLCDSYFTAIAERFFTGKNTIERSFLENFILAKTPELSDGMLPMCFPAEHTNGRYIPNWAMWFVIELWDRKNRCGDTELVSLAKEKVLGILRFFDKYKNEYGLLEDLESWVFIEWSICNDDEYTCGVNYPSNMLYAFMLDTIADLYGYDELRKEAENIRKCIVELAFNGKFFVDNSIRVNGELKKCENHLSETCQYYALFMGIDTTKKFKEMMLKEFGPLRTDAYPEVGRSNMFIGNYLRFFWLLSIGERERTLCECLEYFDKMASLTGTLWEHDRASASCNHGFASVAAHVIAAALFGFETVKDEKPVFKPDAEMLPGYDVKVSFDYNN